MKDLVHPSGRQHVIQHGGQRAVVAQVGGGLREYEVDGFPVLDGYAIDEMASGGRGQLLVPWPNRLADGRYEVDGRTFQLPISEPDRRNAIHGLCRWSGWALLEETPARVQLGHVLWPQPGYPFPLALEVDYELSDAGLRVTVTAENVGRQPAPFGAGQHPYVRVHLDAVDGTLLTLPAEQWLQTDERQIPTGLLLSVAGTELDFLHERPVGPTRLDTAFTGLLREAGGRAWVRLREATGRRRASVWMDGAFDYLMVYTGDTLDEHARRRSLAVEPMTCAPDAFNNGLGLRMLDPGERLSVSWGIAVEG